MKKTVLVVVGLFASLALSCAVVADETVENAYEIASKELETAEDWATLIEVSPDETEAVYNKQVEPSEKIEIGGEQLSGVYLVPESAGSRLQRPGVIIVDNSFTENGSVRFGHAGIMGAYPYKGMVVESNPIIGVKSYRKTFSGSKVWYLEVTGTTAAQDEAAARWAGKQVNKPYNYNFSNVHQTDSFYCSQLVWAAYLKTTGVNLNMGGSAFFWSAIHPSELLFHPRTRIIGKNH